MIYESVLEFNLVLSIIAMVVSILTLASFMKVFHSMFMGPQLPEYANVKEVPPLMIAGMIIITIFVIGFGLVPDLVVNDLITPAADALINKSAYIAAVFGGGL